MRIIEEVSSEVRIVAVVVVERSSVFVITFGKRSSSLSDVCLVAVRTGNTTRMTPLEDTARIFELQK